VLHAADVQSSGGDVRGHDDVHPSGLEVCEGDLAFALETIAVDRGGREPFCKVEMVDFQVL